mmetsp:Transcript_1304/g.2294  ORF Transcript_1304/g.2294 Transcript_1304/m.2294 type:complete len:205 (-) Transcript_1304:58-672(-)
MLLARVFVLSLHSKRKGDLGYYSAHRTGGYKDGLNDGEFSMKGPKKLDENRARTIRNRGGKNPSLHSAKIPEKAGTRLLKYTWEDDVCVVRIFVEHIPGYKSWAEADISSKGISVRWEDRESVLLLLHNSKKENFYLHIPELYRDVEDVRTVWKRNKCIIKITKRVYEEWPTLDKKEIELPTVEDSQRQAYEERQRKEAENKTK